MLWLDIRKNLSTRAQWNTLPREGAWYPKSVFLLITLYSLKRNCFWSDSLEKQKGHSDNKIVPTLYIQYIQYCTFHVKCPFIDLTFLQPTLIQAPPVQQMHNKEVFETEGDISKSRQNNLTGIKQQKKFRTRGKRTPKYKKKPRPLQITMDPQFYSIMPGP